MLTDKVLLAWTVAPSNRRSQPSADNRALWFNVYNR
jgi:hypothetical protein